MVPFFPSNSSFDSLVFPVSPFQSNEHLCVFCAKLGVVGLQSIVQNALLYVGRVGRSVGCMRLAVVVS